VSGILDAIRRRGRPPRAEAPSTPLRIRFSPLERQRLELAAQANRQRPSDFARDAIVTAAEDCLEAPRRRNG